MRYGSSVNPNKLILIPYKGFEIQKAGDQTFNCLMNSSTVLQFISVNTSSIEGECILSLIQSKGIRDS